MIFFHGTDEESWDIIQKEGVLFGGTTCRKTNGEKGYRYTYLTPDVDVAKKYGDVLLEVEHEPVGAGVTLVSKVVDNYGFYPPPEMTY